MRNKSETFQASLILQTHRVPEYNTGDSNSQKNIYHVSTRVLSCEENVRDVRDVLSACMPIYQQRYMVSAMMINPTTESTKAQDSQTHDLKY